MPKYQLHVSSLNTLSMCGIRYEKEVHLKQRRPPGVTALVGTAVHRTVDADLIAKKDAGVLLPPEQIRDYAADSLRWAWDREGVMLVAEEALAGVKAVQGQAIDKSVRLSGLHHLELAPTFSPIHIQRKFTLDLQGYDFQLAGQIDLQEQDVIRDTKTSSKSPSTEEAERSLQLTTYALAAFKSDGVLPNYGMLDYLVDLKREQKAVTVSRVFRQRDFDPLLHRLAAAVRAIEAGIFVPARPTDWWCSEKWCPHFGDCKYALRPVSVPVVQIAPAPVLTGAET